MVRAAPEDSHTTHHSDRGIGCGTLPCCCSAKVTVFGFAALSHSILAAPSLLPSISLAARSTKCEALSPMHTSSALHRPYKDSKAMHSDRDSGLGMPT